MLGDELSEVSDEERGAGWRGVRRVPRVSWVPRVRGRRGRMRGARRAQRGGWQDARA